MSGIGEIFKLATLCGALGGIIWIRRSTKKHKEKIAKADAKHLEYIKAQIWICSKTQFQEHFDTLWSELQDHNIRFANVADTIREIRTAQNDFESEINSDIKGSIKGTLNDTHSAGDRRLNGNSTLADVQVQHSKLEKTNKYNQERTVIETKRLSGEIRFLSDEIQKLKQFYTELMTEVTKTKEQSP